MMGRNLKSLTKKEFYSRRTLSETAKHFHHSRRKCASKRVNKVLINSYSVYLSIDNIKEFRLMTKKSGESKGCGFIEFGDKASYWVSEITATV